MIIKRFEIKRGQILYRDEMEFRSFIHELIWKTTMKWKGCRIKEISNS